MQLHTLNPLTYAPEVIIDEYESLVWTERFIEPGDMRLVVPATREMVQLIKPGTLLRLNTPAESDEPMLIDSRSIEEGMINASGKTIEAFFNERYISADDYLKPFTYPPSWMIRVIVNDMQNRQAESARIPHMTAVSLSSDQYVREEIEGGPVHDLILRIAKKYFIGMRAVWIQSGLNYRIEFQTYYGRDRTFNAPMGSTILFSPDLENFANIKELSTDVDTKTNVVIWPPHNVFGIGPSLLSAMLPVYWTIAPFGETNPFKLRFHEERMDDIPEGGMNLPSDATDLERFAKLDEMMRDKAQIRAEELRRRVVIDGEMTPNAQFFYYPWQNSISTDRFRLGDIVEVAGNFADPVPAVITEFIQSSDASGTRAYPTFSAPPDVIQKSGGYWGGGGEVTLT